jgi:hypothetical protein
MSHVFAVTRHCTIDITTLSLPLKKVAPKFGILQTKQSSNRRKFAQYGANPTTDKFVISTRVLEGYVERFSM